MVPNKVTKQTYLQLEIYPIHIEIIPKDHIDLVAFNPVLSQADVKVLSRQPSPNVLFQIQQIFFAKSVFL